MEIDLCTYLLKLLALSVTTWLWVFYLIWEYEHYSGRREAKRWWEKEIHMLRTIKCWFGYHAADCVRAEVGGRNVQRCLYCDKVVREYTITPEGAKKSPIIRREY